MKRLLPGLVLAACWLYPLLSGSYTLFCLLILFMVLRGSYEYLRMTLPQELEASTVLLLSVTLSFPVFFTLLLGEDGVGGGFFFSTLLSLIFVITQYGRFNDSFTVLSRLVFGAFYVGFLVAHLLLLWFLPEGNYWLVILVAITAGSDSGAYYAGRKFGKRKLCPRISPNKTVEGAIGGFISSALVAVIFALLLLDSVNWLVLIPVAVLLTGVGILGDLCESLIKRACDIKDSGRILLGHGGVLDRIDSLILTAPLLYYLLIFS